MTRPSPGVMNHLPRDASFQSRRVDDLERYAREGFAARAAEATSIANGATLLRDTNDETTLVALGTDPDTGDRGVSVKAGGEVLLNDGGRLRIRDGGTITVQDRGNIAVYNHDGAQIAQIGGLGAGDPGDTDVGVIFFNPTTGLAAFYYLNGIVHISDPSGREVFGVDSTAGVGLASPHLGEGVMMNTNITTWPATSNTDWTTISNKYMEIQNPRLTWQIQHLAESAGQVRILVAGAQAGATQTVASSFGTWSTNADLPTGVHVGDVPLIELQARVTGGAGQVYAQALRGPMGQQS